MFIKIKNIVLTLIFLGCNSFIGMNTPSNNYGSDSSDDSDSQIAENDRIKPKTPEHDDPLFRESYKAISKHSALLFHLKKCPAIEEKIKTKYFKKGVMLSTVHKGFSDGLRYYTSYFTEKTSQEWAQEKRKTWQWYIEETKQESAKIIDLFKNIKK